MHKKRQIPGQREARHTPRGETHEPRERERQREAARGTRRAETDEPKAQRDRDARVTRESDCGTERTDREDGQRRWSDRENVYRVNPGHRNHDY